MPATNVSFQVPNRMKKSFAQREAGESSRAKTQPPCPAAGTGAFVEQPV